MRVGLGCLILAVALPVLGLSEAEAANRLTFQKGNPWRSIRSLLMTMVHFPDGTIIDAVGIRDRQPEKPERDYGLYLDAAWQPTWPADVVDWEDRGLPSDDVGTARQIQEAFHRAREGQRVEVGCFGGLGRTGTVLACMAVLAGVPTDQAVAWVRKSYDPDAVESNEQEEWVQWFAEHVGRQKSNS